MADNFLWRFVFDLVLFHGHLKMGKNTDWNEQVLEGKYIYLWDDTCKRALTKGKQADGSLTSEEMTRCSLLWHVWEQQQEATGINSARRYENRFIYLNFFIPNEDEHSCGRRSYCFEWKVTVELLNCSVKSSPKFPWRKNPVILSKVIIGQSQQTGLCPANWLIGIVVNFNARGRARKEEGKSCVTSMTIILFGTLEHFAKLHFPL